MKIKEQIVRMLPRKQNRVLERIQKTFIQFYNERKKERKKIFSRLQNSKNGNPNNTEVNIFFYNSFCQFDFVFIHILFIINIIDSNNLSFFLKK